MAQLPLYKWSELVSFISEFYICRKILLFKRVTHIRFGKAEFVICCTRRNDDSNHRVGEMDCRDGGDVSEREWIDTYGKLAMHPFPQSPSSIEEQYQNKRPDFHQSGKWTRNRHLEDIWGLRGWVSRRRSWLPWSYTELITLSVQLAKKKRCI